MSHTVGGRRATDVRGGWFGSVKNVAAPDFAMGLAYLIA